MNPHSTFSELGVAPALVAHLSKQGIDVPFPIQELTIPDAVKGRDVCGKAKTGSGKTLAFGLPLLMTAPKGGPRRPTALVLVPTRELAVQVADVLRPLGRAVGKRVTTVYGGADIDAQARQLQEGTEVVVATPGRLIDMVDRRSAA
ncbi:MAG: DEAD/DEAH box helicase, partial [Acidimicrobiales bacterium]